MGDAIGDTGRLLLNNLDINSHDAATAQERSARISKRQISEGTYKLNTPQPFEAKLQRVNFLGARKPGVVPKMWSKEEDANLKASVSKHGDTNWRTIAEDIPGRNHLQCLQRWKKALRPGLVKGHWSKAEDTHLLSLITAYTEKSSIGNINWAAIAQEIEGRNAKQCRERWFLNLDPSINRGPWTPEEDDRLLKLAAQCGGRWSLISKNMPGRTENSVKTRYHSLQRQEARGRGWTKEEDTTLLNATLVFGREWSKVVKQLPGRSRGQLKKRFAALTQHNPTLIRQVQTVEEQLEKGIIVAPNPPPPPIQPMGAQSLQANLIAQQEGKKATHAPVVSPYVPNSITQNPNQQQTSQQQQQQQWSMHQQQEQQMKQKGMKQRYGSSWMNNFSADSGLPEFSNVQGGRPQQQQHFDPSFVSGYNQQQQHQQNVGGAQANYDFTDSAQQQGVWGMPPSQKVKAQNLKREGQPVNNPILDKILNEQQQQNDYNQVQQMQQQRNKGMKQYSSWGELGNTDLNAIFAADTTTGTAGVPAVMRTGSNKKLGNKMSSSNWGAAVPQQLGTYETGGDLKNFLNML